MANFFDADEVADFFHHIKGGPLQWLVYENDLAISEVFGLAKCRVNLECLRHYSSEYTIAPTPTTKQ